MYRYINVLFAAALVLFGSVYTAVAQEDGSLNVEELYDRLDEEESKSPVITSNGEAEGSLKDLKKLSELSTLAPFEDVAVISRKFLPKRLRFELSGGGLIVLNNAFFNHIGFSVRGAFYFSEKWGLEGQYYSLYSSERSVTRDLEEFRRISTRSLVVPQSFTGVALKWVPIYGKISWFEERIIPFDLFFNLGYGSTETKGGGSGTIHLSVGQNFALSKSLAFRWDIMWNRYTAEVRKGNSNETDSLGHSDLYCGVGVSFFIPEAKYR